MKVSIFYGFNIVIQFLSQKKKKIVIQHFSKFSVLIAPPCLCLSSAKVSSLCLSLSLLITSTIFPFIFIIHFLALIDFHQILYFCYFHESASYSSASRSIGFHILSPNHNRSSIHRFVSVTFQNQNL